MNSSMDKNNLHALPANTCLNEKYVIENILGKGGFGITYGGYQKESGVHVAIKEYFPHRIALRRQENDSFHVFPYPETYADEFEDGRRRFLEEAGILKELKHLDSIVSVYDFFEENGTVYIVMEYIEGLTLRQFVDANGPMTFPDLLGLFTPLILSLSEIHANGLIHRDISPDNLILDPDSRLHLIDFGAAKHASKSDANTVILKAGYAPVESYIPNGKIGTWTDVYSLCATMYFSLTGNPPLEAIHRPDDDTDITELTGLENLLPQQRAAIEQGLQIRPAKRLDNMQKLYLALTAPASPDNAETVRGSALSPETLRKVRILQKGKKRTQIFLSAVVLIAISLSLFLFLSNYGRQSEEHPVAPSAPPAASGPSEQKETPTASSADTDLNEPLLSMVSVTGMKLKNASGLLKKLDASIKIETYYVYDDKVASGYVIHQSVAKDTVFTKGNLSSILLTVSKGAKDKTSSPKENTSSGKTPQPVPATSTPGKESQNKKPDYQVDPEDEYEDFTLE